MRWQPKRSKRRGSVLPLVAMCTFAIMGLVALAIDVGMVAIARNQCQNAADAAAMAGARTINGNSTGNYNVDAVPKTATTAATSNSVFGTAVKGDPSTDWSTTDPTLKAQVHPSDYVYNTGSVSIEVGAYAFNYNDSDPSAEGFQIQFPRSSNSEPYSAVRATVSYDGKFAFGRIFGQGNFTAKASATAVHRPRDVVIVMDLSGSMRFQSLPGIPFSGARTTSMNPDVFPKFGHYSNTAAAALYGNTSIATGSGEMYDPANITIKTNSGDPIVDDFYQNALGATPSAANRAFTRKSNSYDVTPNGDDYPAKAGTSTTPPTYAATVNEYLAAGGIRNAAFETNGYGANFKGFTEGPGYWGKTFFMWPPDPRGATLTDMSVAANQADNGAKDWRQRFFIKVRSSDGQMTPLDSNTLLYNADGTVKTPGTTTAITEVSPTTRQSVSVNYTYRINYAAIFNWLQTSPAPFPSQIRAGKILYYSQIPNASNINDTLWKNRNGTNDNERFWRNYVDFVLGLQTNGTSGGYVTYSSGGTRYTTMIGNGDTFTWGTLKLSQDPNPTTQTAYITGGAVNNSAGYAIGTTTIAVKNITTWPVAGETCMIQTGGVWRYYDIASVDSVNKKITLVQGLVVAAANSDAVQFCRVAPYMNYDDNPKRPKHHYWFGAQTFIDYIGNYNLGTFLWPGNVHEAQAWACKVGIQSAIDDIKNNHPSDYIALCYFSTPKYSSGSGQYNAPVVPLGRQYDKLKQSLWFPPSTINNGVAEISMYGADMNNVPRANGGTSPGMGFMLAYNLLSTSNSVRTYPQPQASYRGVLGGLGRKGAARLVIFETDGAPNTGSTATLKGSGSDWYYPIRLYNPGDYSDSKNVEWPSNPAYANSDVYAVIDQICALDTANPPGHSTKRKPVQIFAIGYGSLFDPANAGAQQTTALTFLQTVQYKGGTATDMLPTSFPDNQRIYGPNEGTGGRLDRMQKAFSSIMQAGVQVSLIQ